MCEVGARVEEPPLIVVMNQIVRGAHHVAVEILRATARQPGATQRAVPMDSVLREAPLHVNRLRFGAVVPKDADSSAVGIRDREIIELLIRWIIRIRDDHAATVDPVEAVFAGVAINDADRACVVVVSDEARAASRHCLAAQRNTSRTTRPAIGRRW